MAGCTCIQVLKLIVITEILFLCVAQNTHMENVAIGKTCGISSTWYPTENCSAAINGNNINLNYPGNCIHTANNDKSPFWWVDLGNEFTISTMTIYGRTDFVFRMTQVNIYLDKNIVKSFTSQDTWTNDKYVITVGRVGRIVNITKHSNTEPWINVCEVEVWVCNDSWYGDCTQNCSYCAGGSVCDKVDGNCTSCETGFQLPHLCHDGWYGDNCTQACGRCANGSVCDKVNGSCSTCQTGFQLPLCKECNDGLHGDDCNETCGRCAGGDVCNKTNGSCTSCQTGFQLPHCKVCANGWYGANCTQTCGKCEGGSFCNNGNGSCASCTIGFHPPLCKACADGRYGENCTQTCGHCADSSVCDNVNGSCTSCQTGFQLPLCEECADGWYGVNCTQSCGNCLDTSVCNKVTGNCTSCKVGFQLPLCKECADGWYGDNCTQTCGQCAVGSLCDNVNGTCVSCKTSFDPPFCTDCQDGWYGNSCAERCGHCIGGNSTCDKNNGSCPSCDGKFQLPLCKGKQTEVCSAVTSSNDDKEAISVAGPVAGAAVGCAAVFFIIGAVFAWWLRNSRFQQPIATSRSPYEEISMTSNVDPSMPTSRPDKKADDTSDYSNNGHNINVYDALKAPDDDSTAAYTSLRFHANAH